MSTSSTQDITIFNAAQFGVIGTQKWRVSPSATIIYPGDPCAKILGVGSGGTGVVVSPMATNKPSVGTDYLVGIAQSVSTNTATATGYVEVMPLQAGQIWLIKPNVAATWDTQAEYDALVGTRVLIDLTSSVYTILATDNAYNGCIIMPLDVTKYPGRVAFAFRDGVSHINATKNVS